MKKLYITFALCFCSFASVCAQTDMRDYFVKNLTPIPYNFCSSTPKRERQIEPPQMFSLPFKQWNGALNVSMWRDFNLTATRENSDPECAIYRTFYPFGMYLVGLIDIGGVGEEDIKGVMVTIDPQTGALIDQLEVLYAHGNVSGMPKYSAYVKEFYVTTEESLLSVTVSQLTLASNQTPHMSLADQVQVRLIRREYRINISGQFELVEEVIGAPRRYPRQAFASDSKSFASY